MVREVEGAAGVLPWARQRPWRVETHVWEEGAVWVVDLHDLDAALTRRLTRAFRAEPPPGAVVWIHGVGRHSGARGPVLVHVLRDELAGVGTLRTLGRGRTAWVVDDTAPGWVRGEWGCATRALFLVLAALAALGLWAAVFR